MMGEELETMVRLNWHGSLYSSNSHHSGMAIAHSRKRGAQNSALKFTFRRWHHAPVIEGS
jgi:hypothetical protein